MTADSTDLAERATRDAMTVLTLACLGDDVVVPPDIRDDRVRVTGALIGVSGVAHALLVRVGELTGEPVADILARVGLGFAEMTGS